MIPLRGDVGQAVRGMLGDTQVAAGQLYTNDFQVPFLNLAYQELWSRGSMCGLDRVQREGYYLLPAFTGIFNPVSAGLTNFREPVEIWERGSATAFAVTNAQPATPAAGQLTLTLGSSLPANVTSGTMLEVYSVGGISDDVNDSWTVTVNSPTSIVLNGCTAAGTYTSGGTVVYSTEQWSGPLDPQQTTDSFPFNALPGNSTPGQTILGMYCLQNGRIKFPACTTTREIKLEYLLSGTLSLTTPGSNANDSMGIDDSLTFLAMRTAQHAGFSKGNPRWKDAQEMANIHIQLFLSEAVRDMQVSGERIVPQLWRPKRNVRWLGW